MWAGLDALLSVFNKYTHTISLSLYLDHSSFLETFYKQIIIKGSKIVPLVLKSAKPVIKIFVITAYTATLTVTAVSPAFGGHRAFIRFFSTIRSSSTNVSE